MEIVRGQRAKLSDVTNSKSFDVTIQVTGLDQADLKFLCILLDRDEHVIDAQGVVFEGSKSSSCGTVAVSRRGVGSQSFAIDLGKAPAAVVRTVFALAIQTPPGPVPLHADVIREGQVTLEAGGRTLASYRFRGADFGKETALQLLDLYLKDVWRLSVVGSGFVGGLAAMLSRYHVTTIAPVPGAIVAGDHAEIPADAGPAPRLPATWPGGRTPAIPQDLIRSVGLVVVERADGQGCTGTGFVVTPGGHFLTCHHVVEGARQVSICLEGTGLLRRAEILCGNEGCDLALLWIADRNGVADWMMLADPGTASGLGTELGLFGYPLGYDLGTSVSYSQGIVNSVRRKGELTVLQIDAGAAPGSSGGPVFRRSDGRVVGMLTSGLHLQDRGMLINFAIDIQALWRLGWLSRSG